MVLASLLVVALTAFAWLQEKRTQARVEIESTHHELELALATLSVRMASMAISLQQAPEPTPSLFARLYADLTRSSPRTHERALALIPALPGADALPQLVSRWKADYDARAYPEFTLFPDVSNGPLFPVLMVEPAEAREKVFGYNVGSSARRVAAAREALERGVMTTSAPVSLSQDADTSRASFLLLYPVRLAAPAPQIGFDTALLAAGMTPAALFAEHVALYDRLILELEIGIAGTALPVTLDQGLGGAALRVPLAVDVPMPAIRTGGLDVPFTASVFYVPRAADAVLPLITGAATAVIGILLMNLMATRAATKRALEDALARKEAELRDAYTSQARSQRVEALGRLVGGVAHDFNNILSVILGNLELMKEEDRSRVGDPLVEEAIGATQRGAHLTRQLLSVGRRSHLQPQSLDVSQILQDTTAMLARVLPESITVTTATAAGLWKIEADADGLQTALLNLAINARDAMDGRGKLTLEAANIRATQDYLDARPEEEIAPGRYVSISMTDTGSGMPAEVAERAFEPFFTTKHATDGSGLGLPSVLGFCRQSGGTCRIYSEVGVGTTVQMILPVSEDTPAREADGAEQYTAPAATARVLLAEDEDGVARIMQRQLHGAGYTVTRVGTGDAAWSLIGAGQAFDVLITDLVMPGEIQGAELARRVETARPEMRILLISGYPQEAAIEGNGVARRHVILTKPVPRTDLLRTLDRLLGTTDTDATGA